MTLPVTCILSQKMIPDIVDSNLKNDYKILIIFGTNIPDTTGHQMTVDYRLIKPIFLYYLGNQNKRNAV